MGKDLQGGELFAFYHSHILRDLRGGVSNKKSQANAWL